MVFMISEMLAPPFRWSISITWAVLLPPRMPAGFGAGAAFLPWGAFLAAGCRCCAGRSAWCKQAGIGWRRGQSRPDVLRFFREYNALAIQESFDPNIGLARPRGEEPGGTLYGQRGQSQFRRHRNARALRAILSRLVSLGRRTALRDRHRSGSRSAVLRPSDT